MRSACAGRDLVPRRILEPSGADAAAAAAAAAAQTDMMVYPDPQWSCSAPAPMLQLYDDVGYRGKYLPNLLRHRNPFFKTTESNSLVFVLVIVF